MQHALCKHFHGIFLFETNKRRASIIYGIHLYNTIKWVDESCVLVIISCYTAYENI